MMYPVLLARADLLLVEHDAPPTCDEVVAVYHFAQSSTYAHLNECKVQGLIKVIHRRPRRYEVTDFARAGLKAWAREQLEQPCPDEGSGHANARAAWLLADEWLALRGIDPTAPEVPQEPLPLPPLEDIEDGPVPLNGAAVDAFKQACAFFGIEPDIDQALRDYVAARVNRPATF